MLDLVRMHSWKEALENHGFLCDLYDRDPSRPQMSVITEDSDEVCCWLHYSDDDHSAAEFISRVTEKVFTTRHYYEAGVPNIVNLKLMVYQPDRHDYRCIAIGPTKLEALLNALQSLPVEEGS